MIKISNLTSIKTGKGFTFSDLNLNFEEKKVSNNSRNTDIAPGNDLVIDYDVEAIKNSIRNLLFQRRFLSNTGTNLKKYIGETISDMKAITIGEDIDRALTLYEPRIKVEKIYVGTDLDKTTYFLSMVIKIVNFDNTLTLHASFDKNGTFQFVNR